MAAFAQIAQVKLFFIAGIVAVACGLAGDVMNDFKAGAVLGTNPRAQWIGQAIGGIVGAGRRSRHGRARHRLWPGRFGPDKSFVAAQASVVATMVSGIPSVPWFVGGFIAGIVMYWLGIPAMMIGLGVYLPFYMSLTAFLLLRQTRLRQVVRSPRRRRRSFGRGEGSKDAAFQEQGLVVASGLLGGESIVGVILAFVSVGLSCWDKLSSCSTATILPTICPVGSFRGYDRAF